jgi:hypothetical protein
VEKGRIEAAYLPAVLEKLKNPGSGFLVVPMDLDIAQAMSRVPRSMVPDLPDRVISANALPAYACRAPCVSVGIPKGPDRHSLKGRSNRITRNAICLATSTNIGVNEQQRLLNPIHLFPTNLAQHKQAYCAYITYVVELRAIAK